MGFTSAALVITGVGLLIRVLVLAMLVHKPLISDAYCYYAMGLRLFSHRTFSPFWPPGLPYYLSFFFYVFGASEVVARASMLLIYLLFSALLFLLTREMSSVKVANLVVMIFAFFPTCVFYSVETYTQLPTATCLIAVVYLALLIVRRPHWIYYFLLGLSLGALILTRASNALFLVLAPFYSLRVNTPPLAA
jgi:4-amino-4-deoxy-L-arabinose transferase-like glycosyltransferase